MKSVELKNSAPKSQSRKVRFNYGTFLRTNFSTDISSIFIKPFAFLVNLGFAVLNMCLEFNNNDSKMVYSCFD